MTDPRLLQPNDWAAVALKQATEAAGTPEGAQYLVEARRYMALGERIGNLSAYAESLEREIARLTPVAGPAPRRCADRLKHARESWARRHTAEGRRMSMMNGPLRRCVYWSGRLA